MYIINKNKIIGFEFIYKYGYLFELKDVLSSISIIEEMNDNFLKIQIKILKIKRFFEKSIKRKYKFRQSMSENDLYFENNSLFYMDKKICLNPNQCNK